MEWSARCGGEGGVGWGGGGGGEEGRKGGREEGKKGERVVRGGEEGADVRVGEGVPKLTRGRGWDWRVCWAECGEVWEEVWGGGVGVGVWVGVGVGVEVEAVFPLRRWRVRTA